MTSRSLHQVYLGGIQQMTDVNFSDVTLHYALLLWMTGRKTAGSKSNNSSQTTPSPHDEIRKGLSLTSRKRLKQGMKPKKSVKKSNSTVSVIRHSAATLTKGKLPLLNIQLRNTTFQGASSSIIELSNLPKMIVPAHYITRIVSKQPFVNSQSTQRSNSTTKVKNVASKFHTKTHMKPKSGEVKTPNISVNFVHNHPNQLHSAKDKKSVAMATHVKLHLKSHKPNHSKTRHKVNKKAHFSMEKKKQSLKTKMKASRRTHKQAVKKHSMNKHRKNVLGHGHKKPV